MEGLAPDPSTLGLVRDFNEASRIREKRSKALEQAERIAANQLMSQKPAADMGPKKLVALENAMRIEQLTDEVTKLEQAVGRLERIVEVERGRIKDIRAKTEFENKMPGRNTEARDLLRHVNEMLGDVEQLKQRLRHDMRHAQTD